MPISVYTGAAWLSSARAVRCPVKSGNERNPYYQLPSLRVGTLVKLLVKTRGRRGRRQVIMALMSWATHMLQWRIQRVANPRGEANLIKVRLSSDCRLQLAYMKLESLVIAGQPYSGEFVPGPCTHRPSHHGSWLYSKPFA